MTPPAQWEVKEVNANKTQEADEKRLHHDYFSASQGYLELNIVWLIHISNLKPSIWFIWEEGKKEESR